MLGDDGFGCGGVRPLTSEPGGRKEEAIPAPVFCFSIPPKTHGAWDGWQMFVRLCVRVRVPDCSRALKSAAAAALSGIPFSRRCRGTMC